MRQSTRSLDCDAGSNVLDDIVDQITEKLRRGEPLDLDSYVRRHPELEDPLRRLMPGLQMLAALGEPPTETPGSEDPERKLPSRPARGILGDYRIVREIGRGGMGVVYEAEQVSLGRKVALKVLPFAAAMDHKQLQRFQNEARAAASLRHPNVVQVHFFGCERAVHFYAMDYIEGQTLAELIHHQRRRQGLEDAVPQVAGRAVSNLADIMSNGRFAQAQASSGPELPTAEQAHDRTPEQLCGDEACGPPAAETKRTLQLTISTERPAESHAFFRSIAAIGIQVAEALDYAHQHGLIHRDVKPSNVILDNAGKPWITDFGLARTEGEANLTLTGEMLGTLRYMSPEQIEARRGIVDHRTDVYSLGATLYELLTLEPAYVETRRAALLHSVLQHEPVPPRRINRAIPTELETIVLKALEKDPADRYGTAQELADDLRRFLDRRPIAARRPSLAERFRKWCQRNATLVAAAAPLWLVGAVALAVAAVLIIDGRNTVRRERELRERQSLVARNAERSIRQNRYVVNINLAAQMWNVGEYGKAREDLTRCFPQEDEDDLRGVEWNYLWRLCHSLPQPLGRHDGPAYTACFSPDGALLATGGDDGVRVWEYPSGKPVAWLREHTRDVNRFGFSRDGRLMAVARDDRAVNLWDTSTWKVWKTIHARSPVVSTDFTPDGSLLWVVERAAIDDPRSAVSVNFFDTATWEKHWAISENLAGLTGGAFSPDGRQSAAVFINGSVQLWDPVAKSQLWTESHTHLPLVAAAFSPTRPLLASGSFDGEIFVTDLAAGKARPIDRLRRHRAPVQFLEFTSQGNQLVSASRDRTIRVWEFVPDDAERVAVTSMVFRDDAPLWCVRTAPDGRTLASTNNAGMVRRWDLAEPPDCRRLLEPNGIVLSLHYSPDGERLFAAGWGVCVYDTRTGARLAELARDRPRLECAALSPDGRLLAAGTEKGEALVWDAETYQVLKVWKSELRDELSAETLIHSLAFTADGKALAVGRVNGENFGPAASPVLLSLATGKRLPSPLPPNLSHEDAAHAILFSSDGRWTARRLFNDLEVFQTATLQLRFKASPCWPAAFSADGDLIATAGGGVICVRRTPDWSEVARFAAESGITAALCFSPDGRTLATGGSDGTVTLWNVATGRELMTLADDMLDVHAVAFSPDGRSLAASGTAATNVSDLRIWNLAPAVGGDEPAAVGSARTP